MPWDTLLMDPPFSKEEWAEDIHEDGTPAGQRVLAYLQQYHDAVLGSGRTVELLDKEGLTAREQTMTEALHRKFLRRLLHADDCTERHLETLIAATSFARFVDKD